jgi:enoyl-CoA hydratase
MGISAARAVLQAKTIDADTALARGWIDAVVPKDELVGQALTTARELGQYSPAVYAETKKQLHKPVRGAIDAGASTDENVRARWISEETRGRINGFLESLARGR